MTNGILIHSRGGSVQPPCDRCSRGLSPFMSCRQAPGFFLNDCSGCRLSRKPCSLRNEPPRALVFLALRAPEGGVNGRRLHDQGTARDPIDLVAEDPDDVIGIPRLEAAIVVEIPDDEDDNGSEEGSISGEVGTRDDGAGEISRGVRIVGSGQYVFIDDNGDEYILCLHEYKSYSQPIQVIIVEIPFEVAR